MRFIQITRYLTNHKGPSVPSLELTFRDFKTVAALDPRSHYNIFVTTNVSSSNNFHNMSWRNQGITGSNNIPLGKRRFGGDDDSVQDGGYNPSQPSAGAQDSSYKRGRSPVKGRPLFYEGVRSRKTNMTADDDPLQENGEKRRKKRNRWGDAQENKAAGLMGLPTMIMANMTTEQLEAYTLHLRIEEISQKLRINDVVPADGDR